jgi:hypothetical protein
MHPASTWPLACAALFLTASAALRPAQDPEFGWLTDLDAARRLASERGSPLLVTFR